MDESLRGQLRLIVFADGFWGLLIAGKGSQSAISRLPGTHTEDDESKGYSKVSPLACPEPVDGAKLISGYLI